MFTTTPLSWHSHERIYETENRYKRFTYNALYSMMIIMYNNVATVF